MKGLEKRLIRRMNEEVTFIGFGALEIGRNWGLGNAEETAKPEEDAADKVLNTVLDIGINLVDSARAYHKSEERIGKYISDRRKEYVLATKCGEHSNEPHTYYDFSYKAIKDSIDKSLMLLKTDVIDLLQIHFGPEPKKVLDEGETLRAMKDAQKEGKVRYLGASIDGELATRCINSNDFDVMQMDYNILNRRNEQNIKLAHEKGMGVLIRSGLARGLLTNKVKPYIDEVREKKVLRALFDFVNDDGDLLMAIALNFLYTNKGVSSILLGTKNIEHLKKNFELLDAEVSQDTINQAIEIVTANQGE